jgi:hypothetical protein
MKKATRSLESHFKNLEEKKNSKVFVEYWEKGNKKRTTRSLESHFKNFKKENQKLKCFFRLLEKKETYEESDKKLGRSF